ncbi:MAG: hypothetical protein H0T51_08535 [Pirellulales bacterium]|nr:hypothetical protein [Pirellulales bacterium]
MPRPQAEPFKDFPRYVELPPTNDDAITGLTGSVDAKLELLSLDDALAFEDSRIIYNGKTVAGLRIGDALVEFKWVKGAPSQSVAAVRNSVLKLTSADKTHHIALRSPVKAKAPVIELAQSSFRIYAKCDAPPHHSLVRFTFGLADQLPVKVLEGKTEGMKSGDEVLLQYDTSGDAATKVSVRPAGVVLCADFATQYLLPSGDVEPLTISRGNRKLKQLNSLHSQAINAQQSIGELRSYYQSLESSLRRAQSSGGARDGYAPLVQAQMSVAAGNINREMVATNKQIIRAERLIEDKPSIEADLQEIREIADLAQSIKGTPIPYRFFMVVKGVEVDLVVAE